MSIALVQTASHIDAETTSTTQIHWTSATTSGNLLLAIFSWTAGAGGPGTVTPPAGGGWTLADSTNDAGNQVFLKAYYVPNAASQTNGNKTWSWVNVSNETVIILAEYSGIATSTPLDQKNENSGSGTATLVTSSITTTNANELLIAYFAHYRTATGSISFSTPTNSFVIESQVNAPDAGTSTDMNTALLDRIVTSTGTYSTGVTSNFSTSTFYASLILSFTQAAVTDDAETMYYRLAVSQP